jgi:hypothetical protein
MLELILEVLLDIRGQLRERKELAVWKQSAITLLEKYHAIAEQFPAEIGEDRVDILSRGLEGLRR